MNQLLAFVFEITLITQSNSYTAPLVHYAAPAGLRPAIIGSTASILPGGRIIVPAGVQLATGPGAFGLSVSKGGKIVSANLGPERLSMTVMEPDKKGPWIIHNLLTARRSKGFFNRADRDEDDKDWNSVFIGVAFASEKTAWIAEGNSGRVRLVDTVSGNGRHVVTLNGEGFKDSFTGDLALDTVRDLLYVTDQANFRVAIIDTKRFRVISSVKTGRLPFALALSADGKSIYVTNVGVFHPGPGKTSSLGEANAMEANSLAIINVEDPNAPKLEKFIRTGLPISSDTAGGSSPSGVTTGGGNIYISNAHNDSITIINEKTGLIVNEIKLRIPQLEPLRGIMPVGMAFDPQTGHLLFAAAGINAVGLIDLEARKVSYIPVGWFPTRVVVQDGNIYVSNAKGAGTGPNAYLRRMDLDGDGLYDVLHRGSVSVVPMPADEALLRKHTTTVLAANGFSPIEGAPAALPKQIKHVVLIVKKNRAFDEVLGDLAGTPQLARFGNAGVADGHRARLSVQRAQITPNHHAIAKQWVYCNNFYADSEVSVDGHHWLVGNYPDAWTESSLMAAYAGQKDFRSPTTAPGRLLFAGSDPSIHPEEIQEAGTLWHHLERNKISFRNFGEGFQLTATEGDEGREASGARDQANSPLPSPLLRNSSAGYPGFNMNIPDQFRASQFIQEIDELYTKPGKPLPQFIFIYLPNDQVGKPRLEDGYPFGASYVADNDYALGRIVQYLSHSPWWKEMAVFVTEDSSGGGFDHIDSHRTLLLGASPWFKKASVIKTNTSFPGLLKTIFRLLNVPPLNLYDATAADLSDAFTTEPDFTPYNLVEEDPRIFVPANAREAKVAGPGRPDQGIR